MLYWGLFLSFAISVLIYAFYPFGDKLNVERHQAEALITAFINQHQAAKNYLVHALRLPPLNNTGIDEGSEGVALFPQELDDFIPPYMESDLYQIQDNNGELRTALNPDPQNSNYVGGAFSSALICVKRDESSLSLIPDYRLTSCLDGLADHQYIITYGARPEWWDNQTSIEMKGTWRHAVARMTHNAPNCGTLLHDPKNGQKNGEPVYSLDNGYRISVDIVNPLVTQTLKKAGVSGDYIHDDLIDLFFCISAYGDLYVPGALYHYDANSNTREGYSETASRWTNLGTVGGTLSARVDKQGLQPTSRLDTGITLNPYTNYTLTLVMRTTDTQNNKTLTSGFPILTTDNQTDLYIAGQTINMTMASSRRNDMVSITYVNDITTGEGRLYVNGEPVKTLTGTERTAISGTLFLEATNTRFFNIKYYDTVLEEDFVWQNYKWDKRRYNIRFKNKRKVEYIHRNPNDKA